MLVVEVREIGFCIAFLYYTINVSSTNLRHISGGSANELMALTSRWCMKMSAANPDVEVPIARPWSCWYILLLNTKYVCSIQILYRATMFAGLIFVVLSRSGSARSF